ncbi:unnamed protein product [Acanthoscelides obtectus]|uniref:Uncharacterized protein n=1 Tax=Acanthoscelides obtectus TaxID=200917 RepID=A0A9P0PWA4_ACAOB|nr:unnamed protein product [Acanthoscelides obtectus]CAK1672159.1 hypothetical protein AOBTE_LOCUS28686 [Acanthoscelides obtectus]
MCRHLFYHRDTQSPLCSLLSSSLISPLHYVFSLTHQIRLTRTVTVILRILQVTTVVILVMITSLHPKIRTITTQPYCLNKLERFQHTRQIPLCPFSPLREIRKKYFLLQSNRNWLLAGQRSLQLDYQQRRKRL